MASVLNWENALEGGLRSPVNFDRIHRKGQKKKSNSMGITRGLKVLMQMVVTRGLKVLLPNGGGMCHG